MQLVAADKSGQLLAILLPVALQNPARLQRCLYAVEHTTTGALLSARWGYRPDSPRVTSIDVKALLSPPVLLSAPGVAAQIVRALTLACGSHVLQSLEPCDNGDTPCIDDDTRARGDIPATSVVSACAAKVLDDLVAQLANAAVLQQGSYDSASVTSALHDHTMRFLTALRSLPLCVVQCNTLHADVVNRARLLALTAVVCVANGEHFSARVISRVVVPPITGTDPNGSTPPIAVASGNVLVCLVDALREGGLGDAVLRAGLDMAFDDVEAQARRHPATAVLTLEYMTRLVVALGVAGNTGQSGKVPYRVGTPSQRPHSSTAERECAVQQALTRTFYAS